MTILPQHFSDWGGKLFLCDSSLKGKWAVKLLFLVLQFLLLQFLSDRIITKFVSLGVSRDSCLFEFHLWVNFLAFSHICSICCFLSFKTLIFKDLVDFKLLSELYSHSFLFVFLDRFQVSVDFLGKIFSQRSIFSSLFIICIYDFTLLLQFKIFRSLCLSTSSNSVQLSLSVQTEFTRTKQVSAESQMQASN